MSRKLKILVFSVCVVAAVVITVLIIAYFRMRSSSAEIPPCHLNLELIEVCKQNWANDNGKTANDKPTWDDLRPYFPDWLTNSSYWTNGRPICPEGGTYTIGQLGEKPRCSIGGGYGHSLP
jgi:hypothetical protein